MDPLQHNAVLGTPMKSLPFPEDILHMVFTEYLPKPAVHFASMALNELWGRHNAFSIA